mmetsp:Transcript_31262/g.89662  ORF Transcript_31262/g.89662 Transcript_31262/m.89662 type:complete len:176 (+) Transcript_31262:93-620(+)
MLVARVSKHSDCGPHSEAFPTPYPELKDSRKPVSVPVDIRGFRQSLRPDERFIEHVYVDGDSGPMVLDRSGNWKYVQHSVHPNWGKSTLVSLMPKRWSVMTSTEKGVCLGVIAKRNWQTRGELDEEHPEYRDRSFAAEALAQMCKAATTGPDRKRDTPQDTNPQSTLVFSYRRSY